MIVDLATLRALVSELPGSREDVKWGADLCFCVGPKMYCVYGLESGGCSFKTDPETFARLCTRPGWGPAPYVARYHWVRIEPGTDVDPAELRALVTASYTAVARGLKKADRPAPAP